MKRYFVTGIGTDVGKTIVSAILVEALKADYWKPVQTGAGIHSDHLRISTLSKHHGKIFANQIALKEPLSPHAAAACDRPIVLKDFQLPTSENPLIVEGAGGILVPLNDQELIVDLIVKLALPVIVVSKHYLGSINHTLMTIECLRQRQVKIAGIIFVGNENRSTEDVILKLAGIKKLARIPWQEEMTPDFISQQAEVVRDEL